ncbi:MAG: PIN domain-containing protein [Terriglobales bacterium]
MTGILVDTNLLVYAADPAEAFKRERAMALLAALGFAGRGCISAQSLSEYVNVVLRRKLLSPAETDQVVTHYAESWRVFDVTSTVVRSALRGVREHRLNI